MELCIWAPRAYENSCNSLMYRWGRGNFLIYFKFRAIYIRTLVSILQIKDSDTVATSRSMYYHIIPLSECPNFPPAKICLTLQHANYISSQWAKARACTTNPCLVNTNCYPSDHRTVFILSKSHEIQSSRYLLCQSRYLFLVHFLWWRAQNETQYPRCSLIRAESIGIDLG